MFWGLLASVKAEMTPIELVGTKYAVETGKRVTMKLSWTSVPDVDYYILYKKKYGETEMHDWQSIGTFDYIDNEPVKVLNAYPSEKYAHLWGPGNPGSDWTVSNCSVTWANKTHRASFEKSAALKVWMEGGKIDNEEFTNFGQNQVTGGQSIQVDLITIDDLNLGDNVKKIWNYDMVVFGTWNGAASRHSLDHPGSCNHPNEKVTNELVKYIESKHGVIASHDSMGIITGTKEGLGRIRKHFGVKVGGRGTAENRLEEVDEDYAGTKMTKNWALTATTVHVVKWGQVIDYPWNLSGRELHIPATHSYGNLATGDVWMTLDRNGSTGGWTYEPYPNSEPHFYLTTLNTTAVIQTGHSRCQSTEDERKVWANLIYSLKQRTNKTIRYDHSCVDEDAPREPVCSCYRYENNLVDMECIGDDRETLYMYKVEGFDSNNLVIGRSGEVKVNTASNFSHFIYRSDTNPTIGLQTLLASGTEVSSEQIRNIPYASNRYMHIISMDESQNPSDIVNIKLDTCTPITHTVPFTEAHGEGPSGTLLQILRVFIGMQFISET